MTRVLKIDASARHDDSVSRQFTDEILARLKAADPSTSVVERDLSSGLPFVDAEWIGANFTPEEERSADQKAKLAMSDALIEELGAADIIVLGAPIYNFGVPAALKAWIDLVARARKTFQYTENGPVGLLKNKRAIVAVASGGTEAGSEIDFATPYLRHVFGFLGIDDVTFVAADRLMVDAEASIVRARAAIDALDVQAAA